jgi:hypothetical protein
MDTIACPHSDRHALTHSDVDAIAYIHRYPSADGDVDAITFPHPDGHSLIDSNLGAVA